MGWGLGHFRVTGHLRVTHVCHDSLILTKILHVWKENKQNHINKSVKSQMFMCKCAVNHTNDLCSKCDHVRHCSLIGRYTGLRKSHLSLIWAHFFK